MIKEKYIDDLAIKNGDFPYRTTVSLPEGTHNLGLIHREDDDKSGDGMGYPIFRHTQMVDLT